MNMKPFATVEFGSGPPIRPVEQLLAWLESDETRSNRGMKLLRLPVAIRLDEFRLGLRDAVIGASLDDFSADVPHLELLDSTMSVGLMHQLLNLISRDEAECVVWLEGYWGSLVEIPDLAEAIVSNPDEWLTYHSFTVRRFLGRVGPRDEPHIFIEHTP